MFYSYSDGNTSSLEESAPPPFNLPSVDPSIHDFESDQDSTLHFEITPCDPTPVSMVLNDPTPVSMTASEATRILEPSDAQFERQDHQWPSLTEMVLVKETLF